ncbi:hypothetical protein AQUCO_01500382v1 [Aquilegia coerulea]|uniref:UBA domain-containing protein n=1 Tax=Aquilegia coerulea TaxID=218851 RepID=A0A2G5DTI1_AQUCA|nr:hypothetical protein AQUCO_01500382v1 [Aquilegia coerulea]PIA46797.1 hypothetical protein AQUCO_01500382v1 [Aquilegia coerulea]
MAGTTNNIGLDLNAVLTWLSGYWAGYATGEAAVRNVSDVIPEELYASELSLLQEMGFFDTQEIIRALIATAGNVHAAVERLFGSHGQ